jgi:aminopeptidase N
MNKSFKLFFVFLCLVFNLNAQQSGSRLCAEQKQISLKNIRAASLRENLDIDQSIDVKYHHLNLKISHTAKSIEGIVQSIAVPVSAGINTCSYNLSSILIVDSVKIKNKKITFQHSNNTLKLNLDKTYLKNESINTVVYYHGIPKSSAFGSFSFDTHGSAREPVFWTLSESYGGPDWWPCKDDPADKVDSSEVWITMLPKFVSVSNGNLMEVLEDKIKNTKTYKWKNSYPIAHYLISIASSNYELYENQFKYSATASMKVSHYIYPEVLTTELKKSLDETVNMLQVFSDKYGLYPFTKEKYGHAMCNFGGGMEHQTVSSMGGFDRGLIAHELAHQWFGDKVTCKTWSDIWINEGFATFSEALYEEVLNGRVAYDKEMSLNMNGAKKTSGSIFVQNPSDENQIFNYNRTYLKGAVVLHMLRGILGDEMFFKVFKEFINTDFAFEVASIRDFQGVVQRISGKDLSYFFDQWLFGESYPAYNFAWAQTELSSVQLSIKQTLRNTSPNYFKMPIKFKLNFEDGSSSLQTLTVEALANQTLQISNLKAKVLSIDFDPENYILKDFVFAEGKSLVLVNEFENASPLLFPNPSHNSIKLQNLEFKWLEMRIFNQNSQEFKPDFINSNEINISNLSAGKYYLQVKGVKESKVFSFVKY